MNKNPYVGPRSIGGVGHEDEKLYGRDREIGDLMDLVIAERIVLLYSPSGAGKTSLLQAGLKPALEKLGFAVRRMARVNAPTPEGFDRATGNRYALSSLLSFEEELDAARRRTPSELTAMSLVDYLGPAEVCEVIIIDQFEEVLTVDPADFEEKYEFFVQLGEALENQRRWAVLAMREDYLAGLDPYLKLMPTRLSNQFRLDLLKQDAAVEAMQGPAAERQVEFTADAAAALAVDLSQIRVDYGDGRAEETRPGLYVEPVHLQVVCRRLWEQLPEGTQQITTADLKTAGDVNAALRAYYDDTLKSAVAAVQPPDIPGVDAGSPEFDNFKKNHLSWVERDLRMWFDKHLITPQKTRGQALHADRLTEIARDLLEAVVDAHLVRRNRIRGSLWYELAHDRLIQPVLASNAEWFEANLSKVQKAAAVWEAQGRPQGLLLTGDDLIEAGKWVDAGGPMIDVEKQFLEASERQEAVRQVLAEQQASLRLALARSDLEQSARLKNDGMPAEALAFLARSLRLNPESFVARTRAAAMLMWARARVPLAEIPFTGTTTVSFSKDGKRLLLAAAHTHGGQACVFDVETGQPVSPAFPAQGAAWLELDFDGGKALLLTPRAERLVMNIVDVATTKLREVDESEAGWAEYSFDGSYILLCIRLKDEWESRLFDARGKRVTLGGQRSWKGKAVFSPAGDLVAFYAEQEVSVWNLSTGEGAKREAGAVVEKVAISVDGCLVLISAPRDNSLVWDLGAGKVRQLPWDPDYTRQETAFSPDGHVMLASDGEMASWDPFGDQDPKWREYPFGIPTYESGAPYFEVGNNRKISLFDASTLKLSCEVWSPGRMTTWAATRDGRRYAVAPSLLPGVFVFDTTPNPLDCEARPSDPMPTDRDFCDVQGAKYSPDGSRQVIWSSEEAPELRDRAGALIAPLNVRLTQSRTSTEFVPAIFEVEFSPDSQLVAVATKTLVTVFEAATGLESAQWTVTRHQITAMTFSSDSWFLAVGSENCDIRVWEARTGVELDRLEVPDEAPHSLGFSPDSSRLLAVTKNGCFGWDFRVPQHWCPVLADLAEAAGGLKTREGDNGGFEEITLLERYEILRRLLQEAGEDELLQAVIVRWLPGVS